MSRQRPSEQERERLSQGELVILEKFDYTPLNADIAQQVQRAVQCIRELVKRTLEDLIAVGRELLAVKEALPYGSFGPWLRAEFGWTERTARNFIAVALRFGPRTEIISELRIEPTAAYLLAAPSAPEEASETAVKRAESGERITVSVAKEILDTFRKQQGRYEKTQPPTLPTQKLLGQLLESLESFRRRWEKGQLSMLARQLREFADSLEERNRRTR